MSIARHHAEWLSLLEISGPFLSMPVLLRAFPQGLEAHDPEVLRDLRTAYEEWRDNQEGLRPDPSIHNAWVRFVLTRVLELKDTNIAEGQAIPTSLSLSVPEHGETLRSTLAIIDGGKPRLLIQVFPPTQNLDKPVVGSRWKDPVATRMMELLHGTGVRLGLATDGERWMLVDAPRNGTTGYISWYASLWLEEHITLRAFRSLLGNYRFFNVPDKDTLESLLAASADEQQEVTNQLGYQVRRAVEVLIQALDRADQDRQRQLLAGISEATLYEAALTVMMRLVFLLSAEERKLLLLGDPLYDQNYAVSTLLAQLEVLADQQGEEILERRYDAWCRLLATFRAVYSGIAHENLKLLPYGGSLFNPDRFPFLEGRTTGTSWRDTPANPLPINNRTVLHLLKALQYLQVKVPGGGPAEARRLSFRALDIEQIGHVYEGLLDHTVKRAYEPVLGLAGAKNEEPEIALSKLEAESAGGGESFIEFLKEETGRSPSALTRAWKKENGASGAENEPLLRVACRNDDALLARVQPYAGLMRSDDFGIPLVVNSGSVYMTSGTDRRSTGTHYTPRSLTEPIVQHTLEPLVYIGPAEGLPREQWRLRSAAELLDLKICDMSMGSGAFLVQADRYLAERLLEAWDEVERSMQNEGNSPQAPHPHITPEGKPAAGSPAERIIPDDDDERMALAQRLVAERCLYGVDKNHLAVEMAKLSLWLVTASKDRPFTFLDHALKCGDSLVGADADMFERWTHSKKDSAMPLFEEELRRQLAEARDKRRELESFEVATPSDAGRKNRLLSKAESASERVKLGCDILVGAQLLDMKIGDREKLLSNALIDYVAGEPLRTSATLDAWGSACEVHAFHWQFEFPEVFERGGFSAFVGNPPFLGGRRISFRLNQILLEYLKETLSGRAGTTDLCVYFLLRAYSLSRDNSSIGMILSDIISQGDSRISGLESLEKKGAIIYHAVKSREWPGEAGVKIALVNIRKGAWLGKRILNEEIVGYVNSFLQGNQIPKLHQRLAANEGICYSGHYLMGQGFVLSPEQRKALLKARKENSEVIFPYVRGDDINNTASQSSGLYAINFSTLGIDECRHKYPECLEIVQKLVKPERDRVKPKANRERWWQYARTRPGLEDAIRNIDQVIVQPFTAKFVLPTFVSSRYVFAHPIVVIVRPYFQVYAAIQSSIHEKWVWQYCSTSLDLFRYTASSVLETFPFPGEGASLETVGRRYYEYRQSLLKSRGDCLTAIYNDFHDPQLTDVGIVQLRRLHVELDLAVIAAYGWQDLELGHGFCETSQGIRFTISENARQEVLARLLRLNNERCEEEARQGLDEKEKDRTPKAGGRKRRAEGKKKQKAAKESGEGYKAKLL